MPRSPVAAKTLWLDEGQCIACAICVDVCPQAALAMGSDDLRPTWRVGECNFCGVCAAECPTGAIRIDDKVTS
jgi:formate hydrogenlyase subunit 6/NADH:ubiquinone oxidoreductase subunit I